MLILYYCTYTHTYLYTLDIPGNLEKVYHQRSPNAKLSNYLITKPRLKYSNYLLNRLKIAFISSDFGVHPVSIRVYVYSLLYASMYRCILYIISIFLHVYTYVFSLHILTYYLYSYMLCI